MSEQSSQSPQSSRPSPQEQFTEAMRAGQQAMADAVQSWTKGLQGTFGAVPEGGAAIRPEQVIDQVFDFAERMLEVQREFAKSVVATAAGVATGAAAQAKDAATPPT
jgi:hypothetical protein